MVTCPSHAATSRSLAWLTRPLAAVGLMAAILLGGPAPATAQCAPPRDTAAAIATAEVVFVGRTTAVSLDGRVSEMEVTSIWKGPNLPGHVEVRGALTADAPPSGSDRQFQTGVQYLVVAENGRDPFMATACSATQRFSGPANLIPPSYQEAAGTASGRQPVATVTGDGGEAAVAAGVVPLLGVLALIAGLSALVTRHRNLQPERAELGMARDQVPAEKPIKTRKPRRRNFARDAKRGSRASRRLLKKQARGFWLYRRRVERHLTSARRASGSTETS